ncbi:MAG: hypothetical protein GTO55_06560 [Armatimonadetes bacterium]|nr:hypothetical protein [Armatimonadota bacterium]NIM23944.1 hypothetical protein [Armatimonadota bacterium]NIM67791.1 hypothetical protein [Armatimonadota bacterium]NIM76331.1 hypothetical protein [Armatimonadota bacterium]NIN06025.1 hypothetical protein [Armatimonadota bacterium]
MLFDAAVTTALVGSVWLLLFRLRKGAFPASLGKIDLRLPYLFVVAFGIQLILTPLAMMGIVLVKMIFPAAFILSYLILVYAAFRNWHLFGMRVAVLGIAMNFLVVTVNLGHMPADLSLVRKTGRSDLAVAVELGRFPRAKPLTPETRLPFLADILALPRPYPRPCVFSLGDVFITVGACWLILSTMGLLPQSLGTTGHGKAKSA